jgi:hypothetical protein
MIFPKIPLQNKKLLVKFIPYVIIIILSTILIFNLTNIRHLKRDNKSIKKEVKLLEKEIKKRLIVIDELKEEYNDIIIPNVDSLINEINEKDYSYIDTMSIDELKKFLTDTN